MSSAWSAKAVSAPVTGTGGAFTKRADIAAGATATVDNTAFKYRIQTAWNWRNEVDQTAELSSFQIVYTQP